MNLEIYQQQVLRNCRKYEGMLSELSTKVADGSLTEIEAQGLLHTLQIITENAIGKAKHLLKYKNLEVPVSAYDAFEQLARHQMIATAELETWRKIIGLRNVIVHEYLDINMDIPLAVVREKSYGMILDFLRKPFEQF